MLTIIIAVVVSIATGYFGGKASDNISLGVFYGLISLIAIIVGSSWILRKKMDIVMKDVQGIIEAMQKRIQRKMNMMQQKNMSSGKTMQRSLEKEQKEGIMKAIKELDRLKPYYLWNAIAERQTNTMRVQLYFQTKEYKKADVYLKKCLLFDPLTFAMKMVREYKNGDIEKLEKSYKKGARRFKADKGTIIHALYSWILVKEKRIDDAIAILKPAADENDNETLTKNWEALANGKPGRFNNSLLGETWYALGLEEPKQVRMKQRQGGGKRRFR